MSYEFLPYENFLGLDEEASDLDGARVLLLPIPYEGTVSYGGGTRHGPRAILHASMQVELYDREFGREVGAEYGVHTLSPLATTHHSPEAMVRAVEEAVFDLASEYPDKLLFVLGGEHAISSGVGRGLARAQAATRPLLVQIDAHSDLRDEYDGTPYSHASIARRLLEDGWDVVQLGIRSICQEEAELIQERQHHLRVWFSEDVHAGEWQGELAQRVHGRDVFLSIDVDGLDPALIPATGTPEPHGLTWVQCLDIVRIVAREAGRILGADCVELAPAPGLHASEFIAAKLVYKTMSLLTLSSELKAQG